MMDTSMRLNKFISDSGYCSRREADRYIEQGVVYVNGRQAQVGARVKSGDAVRVNGILLSNELAKQPVYLLLNKPTGIVSTTDETTRDNIVSFVNYSERIFPVGRLDKDSQGLIILTNNGDIVNKILRAGNQHEKEYIVHVNKPITEHFLQSMAQGVPILGVQTKKCKVTPISPNSFKIILIQGLNRQIRRMCEHLGYQVTKLERIRIMHLQLTGIPLGEYREMTEDEITKMNQLIAKSSGESTKPPKVAKPKAQSNAKPAQKGASSSHKSFGSSPKRDSKSSKFKSKSNHSKGRNRR